MPNAPQESAGRGASGILPGAGRKAAMAMREAQAAPAPTLQDTRPPTGTAAEGVRAFADASLHGRDAAWAAVVYDGERLVRVALAAGEVSAIGAAETDAVLLAARLLEEVGQAGPIYSDSRDAVAAAARLLGDRPSVTAVVWTPHTHNRAADVLSKVGRQTWQSLRKRGPTPKVAGAAYASALRPVPVASLVLGRPRAQGADAPSPASLEQAILALAADGSVPQAEMAARIEARWPDLLALRGRPEHSVRDALASLVRKGAVTMDDAGRVLPAPSASVPAAGTRGGLADS